MEPWDHTYVRKIKEGELCNDLLAFLTTDALAEVATDHSKALPVILATQTERELWLSGAPWAEVQHLQRPLPDGSVKVMARGSQYDGETAPNV